VPNALVSRKAQVVIALGAMWAVAVLLAVFVSFALFLWFRALRTFVVTTFRLQIDSAGNRSLALKVPNGLCRTGLWALYNAIWIGLAVAAQLYVSRSLIAILTD